MTAARRRDGRTIRYRLASDPVAAVDASGRRVTFKISDESVARDGHVIKTAGIQTKNYMTNPVVLFAHDGGSLPIARTTRIWTVGTSMFAEFQFPSPGTHDLADTVYQLIADGFLNACSISWNPITWAYSQDRSRPGGIDFSTSDLLEISIVPVPSLPTALVTARARGIDASPIARWANNVAAKGKKVAGVDLAVLSRAASGQLPADPGRGDRIRKARELRDQHRRDEERRRSAAAAPPFPKMSRDDRIQEAAFLAEEHYVDINHATLSSTVEGRRRIAALHRLRAARPGGRW